MHIMEGYLPMEWCIIWYIVAIISVAFGIVQLRKLASNNPETRKVLAINGIVMFFVSSLKVPSVTGCNSSPAANGLAGSLFGPAVTSVVVGIVLLLQAFLLGFGGLTTLGANIFAMGVAGPLAAGVVYSGLNRINLPNIISLIFAVFFANVFSIGATALELGLAFGGEFYKFFVILAVSQVIFVFLDIIVSVVVFVVLGAVFKDSKLFSRDIFD